MIYGEIDKLIENTSLFVPNIKTCVLDQRNNIMSLGKHKNYALDLSSELESSYQNIFLAPLETLGTKQVNNKF
jgi:hypothetical protein